MTQYISLNDIADEVGVEISTVRRAIKRVGDELGIEITRQKSAHGRWAQCVTKPDADKLVKFLESKRSVVYEESNDALSFRNVGYFYIIQLVPEAIPNRVKIGYTDNMEQRLSEHQTAAPTAKILKSWRCKRSLDQAAMDSITRENCKLVLSEVYEGDIQSFLERADSFFSLMPDPDHEKELSEHSPLNK